MIPSSLQSFLIGFPTLLGRLLGLDTWIYPLYYSNSKNSLMFTLLIGIEIKFWINWNLPCCWFCFSSHNFYILIIVSTISDCLILSIILIVYFFELVKCWYLLAINLCRSYLWITFCIIFFLQGFIGSESKFSLEMATFKSSPTKRRWWSIFIDK